MKKNNCKIPGLYLIDLDIIKDPRGDFARTFCDVEFGKMGLLTRFPQSNISLNPKAGTLRGMHYQSKPHGETKLISCVAGRVYDVLIDLRDDSPTYLQWESFELSAHNPQVLYVPEGLAHGFITLDDSSSLYYHMSQSYEAASARTVRWNDPVFKIKWPNFDPLIISEKDKSCPDFQPNRGLFPGSDKSR